MQIIVDNCFALTMKNNNFACQKTYLDKNDKE